MSNIKKYQSDPVNEDIRNFQIELSKKFPDVKPTSIFRPGAKTTEGKTSRHATGEAIDYSLKDKGIKEYLWNTSEGISLLNKYNLGLLDESEKGNSKFGHSTHIGKDKKLVERAKNRYKELNPINTEVSNLDNTTKIPNFAENQSVPDVYVEPQVQQEQQKTEQVQEQPKPYQPIVAQPIQQEVPQEEYTVPEPTDILGMFQNVSSFVDNPIMQKGGIIENDFGQWAFPGSITKINSNVITMKDVNYPVLGVSDTGDTKLMMPNKDYNFKGNTVTEYPQVSEGYASFLKSMQQYKNNG